MLTMGADPIMIRYRFPFTEIPAFYGIGDVLYWLICQQTSQSNLLGDEVYFAPANAPYSYAVYVDRPDAMNEQDIHSFLRAKDPQLYAKLFRCEPQPLQTQPFSDSQQSLSTWPKKLYTSPPRSNGRVKIPTYKVSLITALLGRCSSLEPFERVLM